MNLPFLLGFGSLEIEERRPRSANEPRVKRLSFAKNRRHVTDDMYRGRRGENWAMVPYNGGRRRQNQIEEWDRRKADAQLRFEEQELRHQHQLHTRQLQLDDQRGRRRTLEARQLNDIILQGQQIPPHLWERMHEIQRIQHLQRMPRPDHGGGPGGGPGGGLPPPPPDHPHHGGGEDHSGHDGRQVLMGPGRPFSDHGVDGPDHEGHQDHDRRGRSPRRGGHGGHHGHGEHEIEIVEIVGPHAEDDCHSPQRRIAGGHGNRLPSAFRRPRRSRSRAHRSHSRPRNHSRMSSRRRPSRPRRYYYSDDSDTESEYERVRVIRPRSRGSLRTRSRHYEDTSSDDSFEDYTPRVRYRLSSKTRRR